MWSVEARNALFVLRRAVRELAIQKIAEIESSDRRPMELVFLKHIRDCMDAGERSENRPTLQ